MMSTESKAEHGVIQSSIGLLQERFRQLQRMKEERQTKQLVRLFSDYKTPTPTSNVSPIILSTSSSYFTTTTTTTAATTTSNNNNNNNNNNNTEDCSIQNNENDDDEELQIFIPPNYMSNKNRKVSCYSSPSTSSTVSLSSSLSSSSSQSRNNNHTINLNDVSLSLWPPTANHCRPTMKMLGASVKEVMKNNNKRPTTTTTTTTSVVSTAFTKDDDSQHFSDVDTTLHL